MKLLLNPRVFIPSVLLIFTFFGLALYIIGASNGLKIVQNEVFNMDSDTQVTQLSNSNATSTHAPSSFLIGSTTSDVLLEYKNDILGLQFSYPARMGFFIDARDGGCIVAPHGANFCVTTRDNASGAPLEALVDNYYQSRKEKLIIDGHAAYLINHTSQYNRALTDLVISGDRNIVFTLSGVDIPREIISSLKFSAPTILLSPYALDITWNSKRVGVKESEDEIKSRSCVEGRSYRIGTVQNGTFKGDTIVARNQEYCEMDCGGRSENELNHYVYHRGHQIPVGGDTKYTINGLSTPDEIRVPNSTYVLKKDFASGFFDDMETMKALFTDAIAGTVYAGDNGGRCLVAERADHSLVYYSLDMPFINKENGELNLTLPGGKKFNESYDIDSDWSCLPIVEKPKDVHIVAYNNIGEPFYAPKDTDEKLKTLFADENTIAAYQKLALTYQQFLDIHPLLYWIDPMGRWIEFKNKKYLMAAEKCKPVIYLYPEEKMDISVYVKPNGGFTHTIPEYNDGWHVTAFPNGTIFDKTSNATFPYLYWAGWSIDTPAITKGWVVERKNIEPFLVRKLTQLGLNDKEIADFNEYWVARLNEEGAPYYKIMFLDQEEFNKMAPLRIEGEKRPDHVIRVVMYAEPSLGNDTLSVQILPEKPSRGGFTVVEWGGSMLK